MKEALKKPTIYLSIYLVSYILFYSVYWLATFLSRWSRSFLALLRSGDNFTFLPIFLVGIFLIHLTHLAALSKWLDHASTPSNKMAPSSASIPTSSTNTIDDPPGMPATCSLRLLDFFSGWPSLQSVYRPSCTHWTHRNILYWLSKH